MAKVYPGFVRIHFEVRECEEDTVEVTPANRMLVQKCELFTPEYPSLEDARRAIEAIKEAVSLAVHEPIKVWTRDSGPSLRRPIKPKRTARRAT